MKNNVFTLLMENEALMNDPKNTGDDQNRNIGLCGSTKSEEKKKLKEIFLTLPDSFTLFRGASA